MEAMAPAVAFDAVENELRKLTLLSSSEEARRGLRLALCEGRRAGFTSMTFAGITFSSNSKPQGGTDAQHQDQRPSPPPAASRRRKTPARKQKDAEKHREKRMKRKLLAVLPIINKTMSALVGDAPMAPAPPPASLAPATAQEWNEEMAPPAPLAGSKQQRGSPGGGQTAQEGAPYTPTKETLKKVRRCIEPEEGDPMHKQSVSTRMYTAQCIFKRDARVRGVPGPSEEDVRALIAQPDG